MLSRQRGTEACRSERASGDVGETVKLVAIGVVEGLLYGKLSNGWSRVFWYFKIVVNGDSRSGGLHKWG